MASILRRSRNRTRSAAKVIPLVVASRVVRPRKIAAAQRRIAAGHYDRPEVREKLVDAVLRELRGR